MNFKNKLLKKLLKWANKNKVILIFTMLHFLKKYKEKHLQISLSKFNDVVYSLWGIEQNILKLVILVLFLAFYPLKTPKIKILKMKKFAVYQKSQSFDVWFLRHGVGQTKVFIIMDRFLSFSPL